MIAIDGSITTMKAAHYGISVARKFNSDLIAMTVVDLMSLPYSYFITKPGTQSHDKILEEKRNEAKRWLDEVERLMLTVSMASESGDIKFRSEIIEDPFSRVAGAIVNYAENKNVDLIVIGTRGRSGLRRMLLGSVASGVLSYARCPVIIVR